MPAEVGRDRFVAVDLCGAQLRVYGQGRVARVPAAVFGDDAGALSFGSEALRLGGAQPAGLEPALPDWIDDDYLALGAGLHRVRELLRALLVHAVSQVWTGPAAPELLLVAAPEYWGGRRRGLLGAVAAGVAARVELVSSARAVFAGALLEDPGLDVRKVVVLEQEPERVLAWAMPGANPWRGTARALPLARVEGMPCAQSLGELIGRAAGPGLHPSAVLVAPRGVGELSAALAGSLPAHCRVVDGDCALRGVVDLAARQSAQFQAPARVWD